MRLGPRPTRADLKKNAQKNYVIRMRVLKYMLEQFAKANGKDPSNFGIISKYYEQDGNQIRQFFMVSTVKKKVIVLDEFPSTYPVGLVRSFLEAYVEDKVDNALGIILIQSKLKAVVEDCNHNLVLTNWTASTQDHDVQ